MKLSLDNFELRKKFGEEKTIKLLKQTGFDALDYSFFGDKDLEVILGEEYISYARNVRRLLDENGLTCNQAHAPFRGMQYENKFDLSDKAYVQIVRAMESASIMGARYIVVHGIKVPEGVDDVQYNLQYYKSLEPYCEKFGICVAIENLYIYDEKCKCYRGRFHTPEILNKMIEQLDSPWFAACVDIGHAAMVGIEPETLITGLNNRVLRILHVHDNDYLGDRHTIPYGGSLNWNAIMKALKDMDYQGDFTFEIICFIAKIEPEFMEEALTYAAKTGRYLMRKRW